MVFNPAPMDAQVAACPLQLVDLLILNRAEVQALGGCRDVEGAFSALRQLCSQAAVVLTLGRDGALFITGSSRHLCRLLGKPRITPAP